MPGGDGPGGGRRGGRAIAGRPGQVTRAGSTRQTDSFTSTVRASGTTGQARNQGSRAFGEAVGRRGSRLNPFA